MTALTNCLIVLLADDDANDVILMRRAFKRLGSLIRLIVVPDGSTAVAYLRGVGQYADREIWPVPDVLLLDQTMPGIPGLDALFWTRTEPRFASLPAVILSGALSPDQEEMAGRLKAATCTKAADPQSTIQAIDQAIRRALELANQAWFGARIAENQPTRRVPETGEIRVWT